MRGVVGAQLEELEKEQEELQAKIATTSYEEPVFSKAQFIAWMNTFKAADHESPEVRKQIIDIFIMRSICMMINSLSHITPAD